AYRPPCALGQLSGARRGRNPGGSGYLLRPLPRPAVHLCVQRGGALHADGPPHPTLNERFRPRRSCGRAAARLMTRCGGHDAAMIETPSPNHDERKLPITMLVLHYTGMPDGESAIRWLANPDSKVSAHYVVTEDGQVVHMVDEAR